MWKAVKVVLILINVWSVGIWIVGVSGHRMEYRASGESGWLEMVETAGMRKSKEEMREEIFEIFGWPICIYGERDLREGVNGVSGLILRFVVMDREVEGDRYAFVLAHELSHLEGCTVNERWASFNAFKRLYESGDEYYRAVAMRYAYLELNGLAGVSEEYECGYYILKYLEVENA